MKKYIAITFIATILCFSGCTDDNGVDVNGHGGGDGGTDSGADTDVDSDSDAGTDSGSDNGNAVCADLGLPERPFEDAESSSALYATAADFTVSTTDGDWNFRENWTGCEVYLFIQDSPRQTWGWPTPLFDRDVDALLERSPDNVHLFFIPTASGEADGTMEKIQTNVEEGLKYYPSEKQERWRERIHYVTNLDQDLEGWLGEIMAVPGWGAGIDRLQRVRYIGSYADYMRYLPEKSWFEPNLSMAANEAIYYNFEAEREATLEAANASIVEVFKGEVISDPGWAGNRGYATATLPEEADTFDTLHLDLYLGCDGDGEFGTCPDWDYLVHLYLCRDNANDDTCDIEIGRWITTYHREGRWVHDISALLPLIAEGGERRFAFYTQQPYEVKLDLRFSNQGKEVAPYESTYLFGGGTFGPEYNDGYETVTVGIPADAKKVELATAITGHGGATPGNCAEFCNTTHHFFVNGEEYVLDFPEAGTNEDCMSKVNQGTVPNQYGTWWYGRSGWCPGKEVPLVITDVTDHAAIGADNTFDYQGFYEGAPYPNNDPHIQLRSWVVVSK